MDLDFVRIECEIATDIPAQLTAVFYGALRSFEAEFRTSCCQNRQASCTSCSRQVGCPYLIVFGRQLSTNPEIVRLHQKPSLPFSFYVNEMENNALFYTVGLVIIGSAVNHLELFHSVLLRIIETALCAILPPSKFRLCSHSLDYQGNRHEITSAARPSDSIIILSAQHILKNTAHSESICLSLNSPLRLLYNGSIVHYFDFGVFFRSQLRRCSSLCAYYGIGELDLDFARLSESAQNVDVLDNKIRYTQPTWSKRLNMAGLTGEAKCIGLVEPMFSLLLLGSYFNAGKGAAFGSGLYQIAVID